MCRDIERVNKRDKERERERESVLYCKAFCKICV